MSEWSTIANLGTAGATLVLGVATFASVRSGNRTARAAERSLQLGLRPLLMTSRMEDPPEKLSWMDGRWDRVEGGHGLAEVEGDVVYLALGLRNAGNGIAVLDSWRFYSGRFLGPDVARPDPSTFRRLGRDLYIPSGSLGFWQGAFRDPTDPGFAEARETVKEGRTFTTDILYGDHDGGQHTVSRFTMTNAGDHGWLVSASRTGTSTGPTPAERRLRRPRGGRPGSSARAGA